LENLERVLKIRFRAILPVGKEGLSLDTNVNHSVSPVLAAPRQIEPVLEVAQIQEGDRVLDVGCRAGCLLLAAARQTSQAVGVDAHPEMLAEAKRRAEEAGLANVTLREANLEALPFADDRFDVVLTRLTLHHAQSPERLLSEIYRVCRPGGRIAVCDVIATDDTARADLHNRVERLRDPSHVRYYTAAELTRLVTGAEFTVTTAKQWQVERRFGEWTEGAGIRDEVKPGLAALLEAGIPGDCAGIQVARDDNGELVFHHQWLVVGGVK
jgi:ubiquinone/menaquinone biosynthesis C-methylase UbiE